MTIEIDMKNISSAELISALKILESLTPSAREAYRSKILELANAGKESRN